MQILSLNIASAASDSKFSGFHLCVFVSFVFHIIHAASTFTPPNNETVPAVIVFGDSIVDPGNNNHVYTIVKCNFPPYGRDFIGGKPTGRFSNGRIPTDMIAEELGIKKLLPPYLDPTLQLDDLLTGVSFASGGAGFDPLTAKVASALSLSAQLELFKEYIGKVQTAVGGERMATILSKSIFIVFAGSNDIVNTYYGGPFRRVDYDLSAYTDLMVKSASSFIEELYCLGARKIGVFSIPPLGCVPSQRTVGGGLQRECAEICNQASKLFNSKISSKLTSLNSKLSYARLVYLDSYFSVLALIQNPGYYGFEEVSKGCCGTGNIEASILCNSLSPHTCTDDSKYVFWDGYHPTEKSYEIIIRMTMPSFSKFFL